MWRPAAPMYARPRPTSTAKAVADYNIGTINIRKGDEITLITSTRKDEESEGGRWQGANPLNDREYRGHNAANGTSGTFPKEVVGELQLVALPKFKRKPRVRQPTGPRQWSTAEEFLALILGLSEGDSLADRMTSLSLQDKDDLETALSQLTITDKKRLPELEVLMSKVSVSGVNRRRSTPMKAKKTGAPFVDMAQQTQSLT